MRALRIACSDLIRRFKRSEDGSAAPLIGLMILVLIGCIGIGIDTGRSVLVRARLVDALDSAGLAVAARMSTADFNADARKFVAANFAANFAGATVTNVTAVPNSDKTVITLNATATMPTAFMKLFGADLVTVNAYSEVTRAAAGLELVMVLDNTGSMEASNSMPSLKDAANMLVDSLFGGETTAKNLYIGLVPFSQSVNIGTTRPLWTDLASVARSYYPAYWTGCIEERSNGQDQTDEPPLIGASNRVFKAYYSPDWTYNNWIRGSWIPWLNIRYNGAWDQVGPGAYCPATVTPMTNVKSKIVSGVEAMKSGGSTMINVGAVWGWRMISPKWRGYWDGDMLANSLPLDYGTKRMSKAVVIMTDGKNEFNGGNYTAYGFLEDEILGTSNFDSANAALDARLTTTCTSMKAAGIIVYTVAFGNPGSSIQNLLRSCASSTSYYFDPSNHDALKTSFKTIGDSLSNLRVSR